MRWKDGFGKSQGCVGMPDCTHTAAGRSALCCAAYSTAQHSEDLPKVTQLSMHGREGILEDMAAHGVECVDCLSVDNALVRIGDPLFAGYCHELGAECGAHLPLHQAKCPCTQSTSVLTAPSLQCLTLNEVTPPSPTRARLFR